MNRLLVNFAHVFCSNLEFAPFRGDKSAQKSEKCDSLLTIRPLNAYFPHTSRGGTLGDLSPCTDVQPGGHYH